MKILILNTVALNGGDGAILTALIQGLKTRLGPRASFVVHEAQPEVASRYYPDVTFRPTAVASLGRFENSRAGELRGRAMRMLLRVAARGGLTGMLARVALPRGARAALDDYLSADVVITTGGTYLVEHYSLDGRILSFELALAARKPLVFYTQSLGPFRDAKVRESLRRILAEADLVYLRDELSRAHVADLGGRTEQLQVVPDCVFSLADPARLAAAAVGRRPPDRPLRVAISVREWRHFTTRGAAEGMRDYLAAVRAAVTHLVERHGATVTFLSTCQGIPEYGHDDSATAAAVADGLPATVRQAVTVDARFLAPRALIDELTTFDLVISTRMHLAILALVSGVPVIPIAYEFKMRELFGHLGQGRWVHDIESVDPAALVASVDELMATEEKVREALFAAVAEAHWRAGAANDQLASLVRRLCGLPTLPPASILADDSPALVREPTPAGAPGECSRDHPGF